MPAEDHLHTYLHVCRFSYIVSVLHRLELVLGTDYFFLGGVARSKNRGDREEYDRW